MTGSVFWKDHSGYSVEGRLNQGTRPLRQGWEMLVTWSQQARKMWWVVGIGGARIKGGILNANQCMSGSQCLVQCLMHHKWIDSLTLSCPELKTLPHWILHTHFYGKTYLKLLTPFCLCPCTLHQEQCCPIKMKVSHPHIPHTSA